MVGVERVGGIGIRLAEIVSWVLPSSSNGSRSSITLILSPVVAAFAFLYGLVSKQAAGHRAGSHALSYELQELEVWDMCAKCESARSASRTHEKDATCSGHRRVICRQDLFGSARSRTGRMTSAS